MKSFFQIIAYLLLSSCIASAQDIQLIIPKGHAGSIQAIATRSDNKYILSASDDFLVILWNKQTGRIIKQFKFNENAICAIEFGNDQSFYILFANGVLIKNSIVTGKTIFRIQATEKVNDFKIINNLMYLYFKENSSSLNNLFNNTKPKENKIEIRSLSTGKLLKTIIGRSFIEVNLNTKQFVTNNTDNILMIYNLKNELVKTIPTQNEIDKLSWVNDSIIYSTKDGSCKLLLINNTIKQLVQLNEKPRTFAVDVLNKNFAVINGKEIIVVNIHDTTIKYTIKLNAFIDDIAFSKTKDKELFFILENGIVGRFDYTNKKGVYLNGHKGWNGKIHLINDEEFITSSDDNYFIVWQSQPLTKKNIFDNKTSAIHKVKYSSANNTLLTLNGNGVLQTEKLNEFNFNSIAFSRERIVDISNIYQDSFVVLSMKQNKGVVYNLIKKEILNSFDIHKDSLQKNFTQGSVGEHGVTVFNSSIFAQYIPTNNTLVFRNLDGEILHTQLILGLRKVVCSENSEYLLVIATNSYLFKKSDDENIELVQELNKHFEDAVFDHTEEKIMYSEVNNSNVLCIYNILNTSTTYIPNQNRILIITEANTNNKVAIATIDSLKVIDINNSKIELAILHSLGTISTAIWKNNSTLILGTDDGTIHFYSIKRKQVDYSIIHFNDNEKMIVLKSNYYFGSTNKVKLLSYVKGLTNIGFEQLDVKYNRPDKVLEAISSTDTALINSYRKAYQKRIKKLGIDTTQFKDGYSVPESDFINRDAIEYEQTKDKLILKIKAVDSTYKLERFNVWVNEVPLFGLRGIQVKRKNVFDTTLTITLSQGENRIETSVININGTESYKMPLFVKYTPAKPIEEKQYFIGIGINQFANSDYNLSWSVKDIRDLALKLKTKYPNIFIDTLFDSNVTKENILALKQKLLQLQEEDKVIVSYSGHGVLSKDFDYFLSTYSINFEKPEEKGLSYDDLENLLDSIRPRQKLMFIDACHSGEVDKDEIEKVEVFKKELEKNGITTKSTIKITKKEKQLGMKNSFELMQSLFVNVGKGTGATIVSAAGGMQYAQERGDLKNGVFTYSILEAFNKHTTLKVSELKKIVGERVTQLTNGLQKPTSRNETNNYDWMVW